MPPILPLIGRDPQLIQLEELLGEATAGRGRFVLITGESGVGKTRLVQEYLDRHPDLPSMQSVCHELEAVVPYAALRQTLPEALELLPDRLLNPPPDWLSNLVSLVPSLAGKFPYLPPWDSPPEESRQVTDALANLVLTLAAQTGPQPLHLILDDLHWGDSPTWGLLARLAHLAATQRLLILGLCRLEDLPQERGRLIRSLERNDLLLHLPLSCLTPEETAALARLLLPQQDPDPLFLSRLYQETEGNPFFVIEIVRAAGEAGRPPSLPLETSGGRAASPALPPSIQRVIEARLDQLAPARQELLATAAAMGSSFTFSLLEETSQAPAEEIVCAIEEWCQRGLVREDAHGYDFSHDKIRQVAYASLSRARRQFIHYRIASVLENAIPPVDVATLAHHYARSDHPLKALPYLTQAGEQALRVRSYQEARQFGLQAVNLLGRTPGPRLSSERIDLNLQLAQAYAFSGDFGRAQEILSETEHLAISLGDETRLGKVFHRSAQIFWLRGQPEVAGDYARRTLRAAEELNDPILLQAALRMLGRVGIAVSTFDDAIAYLLRYANLADDASAPLDLPIVLGYLGVAYARVGSWQRALDAALHGFELAQANSNDLSRENNARYLAAADFARMQLAFLHADRGNWPACLELIQDEAGATGQEETGGLQEAMLTPLGFMMNSLHGRSLAHIGQPEAGIRMIRRALDWAEHNDYRVFHYLPRMFLVESLLLAGQVETAQAEAELTLAHAQEGKNRWAAAVTLRLLAEALVRLPNPNWPQVENNLIQSMTLLRQVRARPDLARTYLALRKLYDRAGQIAWAVDCHFRATSIFEELGMLDDLHQAQGQAAGERRGAVVIPGLALRGPNEPLE